MGMCDEYAGQKTSNMGSDLEILYLWARMFKKVDIFA